MNVAHPKPHGGLEGDVRVCCHGFGIIKPVEADERSGWTVVVVPGQLKWSSAVVFLVCSTWVVCICCVAIGVVSTGSAVLFDFAKDCTKHKNFSFLMGRMCKESRDFPLRIVCRPDSPEC
ncbi:hypothetical protein RHGRI_025457 [Rhododendron griersonianum]|uniref:Transmembrane protein n=1 Tax=Rhododendron griersonianum TaxID=479676 RepID=A0AAV6IP45_9ERIC|nr:hypothetical protein RHGRI_025457 [Rhododendron griersonianum]